MIAIFMAASPTVFLHWPIYDSVLVTLPVALCLVVPLVFVVTVGEIDLSFPATMGFSAWIFALVVHFGLSPFLGIVAALATGMALGACVGALVVTAGLSSLIATLGMNFMLRGFIMIVTQGKSIALLELQDTTAGALFSSEVYERPRPDLLGARLRRLRRPAVQPSQVRRACARGRRQSGQRGPDGRQRRARAHLDLRLHGPWRRARGRVLDHGQLHLVADDRRRLSPARDRLGVRRWNADLGRRRHHCRRARSAR